MKTKYYYDGIDLEPIKNAGSWFEVERALENAIFDKVVEILKNAFGMHGDFSVLYAHSIFKIIKAGLDETRQGTYSKNGHGLPVDVCIWYDDSFGDTPSSENYGKIEYREAFVSVAFSNENTFIIRFSFGYGTYMNMEFLQCISRNEPMDCFIFRSTDAIVRALNIFNNDTTHTQVCTVNHKDNTSTIKYTICFEHCERYFCYSDEFLTGIRKNSKEDTEKTE